MTFGFTPPPPTTDSASRLSRALEPAEWSSAGIPLLRNPREMIRELCERHGTALTTVIVAVLNPDERLAASASFGQQTEHPDGWEFRNALLDRLRRVIPHDLRRRVPLRTAVLVCHRSGDHRWTELDGAWMWGLRDACTLHGLRCGAYITVTPGGWQVFGEERGGRHPHATVPSGGETTAGKEPAQAPADVREPCTGEHTG
ncbi:hypothetical protein [Streptomyces xiaopingdaonensis]|uniref:hypothetical protein n=1 Tax=Streptomyces xiaopingdaonensis TaxID=1565415 RepID=UPI00031293FD|nr:hypothetical protein [Streptomyces xiaopingdaonensis]